MCTVSLFYKSNSDFVLTSNRDEAPNRVSSPPDFYIINDTEILMPQDVLSGGSWIGASNKNRVLCLLNGGFIKHKREASYRQSRGVVVNDLLQMDDFEASVATYNFNNIEPFTLVIIDWNAELQFFELVWDGINKQLTQLPLSSRIWSSSTLYSEEKKEERQNWFKRFKAENELTSESVLSFHKTAGAGNLDYGVIMNREIVRTTSITQIEKTGNDLVMRYENLITSEVVSKSVNTTEAVNG